jgi:ubiquinone/menaquinone biosynthesis C-methylase UbiE
MAKIEKFKGDTESFAASWGERKETQNNYFTRGEPINQIQLAYRQHWSFVREVVRVPRKGRSLEVGCGRGTISSYFAESGYHTTLLDTSATVIETAKTIFAQNNHDNATFIVGNALSLPFEESTFDVTISMGLLEHFKDVRKVLSEQVRVLKKGGFFIGYVVPGKWSVQNLFEPVNRLLEAMFAEHGHTNAGAKHKQPIYRSQYKAADYERWLRPLPVKGIQATGVYPFPAISYSPDFPFSLLPAPYEKALVDTFNNFLNRRKQFMVHPWACSEELGQSFFIWATRK